MNMNQLTQKSLAAIQGAQSLAQQYGQQQIEQQHLLLALVADQEGFIPQLLTAMGMTVPSFLAAVQAEVNKLPKVSGGGREGLCGPGCGPGPERRRGDGQVHEGRIYLCGAPVFRTAGQRQQRPEGVVPHL